MSKGASIHTICKPEYNECYSEAMFDALNLEEIKFLMFFIDTDEQNSNKLDSEIEQIAVSTYKFKGIYKDSMNKKWARLEGDRIEKCKHLE
ncbi:MAG: hypothetical protein L3J46_02640 [Kangiellaceae bacterium]|nr:hypothetical protein [Kangiellaceae bacterium]